MVGKLRDENDRRGLMAGNLLVGPAAEALEADPLRQAQEWLSEGERVRRRLELELRDARKTAEVANARVQQIEDALARMGPAARTAATAAEPPPASGEDAMDLSAASIAEVVFYAVGAFPGGATAADIQRWSADHGRPLTPKFIHTYLHRMRRDGRIVARGEKGHLLYFLGQWRDAPMSE